MFTSLLTTLISFWNTQNFAELPDNFEDKRKFHSSYSSQRIYLKKAPQLSRNFSKKKSIKFKKPWNGHFSAKNFRQTTTDHNYLDRIKKNLRASIIALPKWHTEALKDLEVYKGKNISRGLSNSKKIILHTDSIKNYQELIAVFVHEMGHITDLGALKGRQGHQTNFYDGQEPILNDDLSFLFYKISWENAHHKKHSAKNKDFVSRYAESDCFEDFAESYLFYRLHGEKFRGILHHSSALKKKYEFMKNYVFNGQEFQLKKTPNLNFPYENVFDVTLLNFDRKNL